MSTEFTKTVYDNPHGERILYLLSAVLFNIQGNDASLRAKPVHISGHLPRMNAAGNCAECSTGFTPMIGFLRSRFDQGQAMVAHPAPGVEDAQQEMEIHLASFA